jgi:hypothetical protein
MMLLLSHEMSAELHFEAQRLYAGVARVISEA